MASVEIELEEKEWIDQRTMGRESQNLHFSVRVHNY